ncbi:MAG TPA: hypothetical protein VMD92_13385 [Acidobacteriaceae bacterium]|nr:hypothetical protein [Acidobacteriaceae bacterium]
MRFSAGALEGLARLLVGLSLLAWAVQEVQTSGHIGDMGLLAEWMPAHAALAWLAAAIFLVAGIATLTGYGLRSVAIVMGVVFAVAAVLRFTEFIPQMGHVWGYRGVMSELFACGAGMWMLAAQAEGRWPSDARARRLGAVGLAVFGVADVVLGTIHYQVGPFIATLIPAWMPARLFLAYFTGTALTAAGVAFLVRRWVRPAGLWLSLMFFLWVVLLHAERIAHALHDADEWNSGFVCLCFAGLALVAAHTDASQRQA